MSQQTVLVADDDDDIRDLVCIILRVSGLDPMAMSRGDDALAAARIGGPSLAVLDVNMPGMSGLDVCRALRQDPATADLPVLLISARSTQDDIDAGRCAGADDYLTKPFAPKQLVQRVEQLLQQTPSPHRGDAALLEDGVA